jgi:hypothetical protein
MRVDGEAARNYSAVRLDSFASVEGKGKLTLADDATGEVRWADAAGETRTVTLGNHAIRSVYGR